ncbi:DUF6888 family protein [Gloeocapsopsis dulcis]|uniref:DUF6888 family protein n=1 Tax=Gloeocapsopsis dulcis TaxID=2859516 RepID=UPI00399C1954
MQPTVDQAFACLRVCQMLSNCFQPIHLFRYDDSTGRVFMIAGVTENLEIVVYSNGFWEFADEQT